MIVESREQGVRFEWRGEPDEVVRVALHGPSERNFERLALLQDVVRSQREGGVRWVDLEVRERRQSEDSVRRLGQGPSGLLWTAQFEDWTAAAVAFTVLCAAVGMDDDGVPLEIRT